MFIAGAPGAVNQLLFTQLFAPNGRADTLAAFLFVQCRIPHSLSGLMYPTDPGEQTCSCFSPLRKALNSRIR
jgi:hypothetical protein